MGSGYQVPTLLSGWYDISGCMHVQLKLYSCDESCEVSHFYVSDFATVHVFSSAACPSRDAIVVLASIDPSETDGEMTGRGGVTGLERQEPS